MAEENMLILPSMEKDGQLLHYKVMIKLHCKSFIGHYGKCGPVIIFKSGGKAFYFG